jgi:hypothetical protein
MTSRLRRAAHPEPAIELVEFLASPEVVPIIRKSSLDPVSPPLP